MEGTDSLRELAPSWSLAGDEKLLALLQNTHQKIVSKCREVNTKLDEMVTTLDSASINLQNVNNKFMALSNSQFIESRVYDDDADVSTEPTPIEEPTKPDIVDELTLLKRSLAVLDEAHEYTEIMDSDTDDSDAQISVVLKPKDVYSHRPLPYIIGSQAWKNKWHAGLLIEDSDSDSVTSKPDVMDEEFSESEDDVGTHQIRAPDATISETSSLFHSEREKEIPEKKQTPADVAAELAARLGNAPPRILEEPEDLPQSTPKPVFKPSKPASSTIFSEEPPPLDDHDSDYSEDDIFAEINKPYNYNSKGQNRLTDDLFGNSGDYAIEKEQRNVKQNSTLFYDDEEPELFVKKPSTVKDDRDENEDVKKPVGGISLFGSNKGTESIGAAILKRNQRKSFSSDESDENNIKDDTVDDYGDTNNANAIFDNLFAKAKQAEQNLKQGTDRPVKEKPKVNVVKETSKPKEPTQKYQPKEVKDLFSDNIFDDIDDIFTSNIKIPTKDANKNAKSIFEDADDDLFSDIAKTPKDNTNNAKASSSSIKKSLFDSDDELFSDVKVNDTKVVKESKVSANKSTKETNNNTTKPSKSILEDLPKQASIVKPKSKSIFDSDSDDDLFSNVKDKINKTDKIEESKDKSEIASDFFKEKEISVTADLPENEKAPVTETLKAEKTKVFQSPSLFEEDEIDDLFIDDNKAKYDNFVENVIEHKIPEKIPDVSNTGFTEENVDLNDKKSEITDQDQAKAVLVETKSYVFPKLDEPKALEKPKDNNIVTDIGTQNNEASLMTQTVSFNEEDSNIEKSINKPHVETNNSKNENVLHKEHKPLPDIANESKSTSNENTSNVKGNQDKNKVDEVIEKEDVIPQQKNQTAIANFDDIFIEPPAFEKTKEIKKTTNVNALFDDDSDDEALFFKKNDVISDEKPDLFSPSANFGIFNDEPPAFVDFTPNNTSKNDDLFTSENKEGAQAMNQSDAEWNNEPVPKILEDNLFSSPETLNDNFKTKTANIFSKEIPDSDEDLFSNITKDPSPKTESTKKSIDQPDYIKKDKKIGKLDTKNFNINVQALVPGASPKKIPKEIDKDVKTPDKTEYFNTESNITKNIETTDKFEHKTVSFEDKPASGILDNKISKQRPKIQVKRRPSSRKARHEAVRKSVINLDDDTDNSSSFDEPLPKLNQKKAQDHKDKSVEDFDDPSHNINNKSNEQTNTDETTRTDDLLFNDASVFTEEVESKPVNKQNDIDKLLPNSVDPAPAIENLPEDENDRLKNSIKSGLDEVNSPTVNINELLHNSSDVQDAFNQKQFNENSIKNKDEVDANVNKEVQSTTKVKYILNDEDIFSNIPKDKDLFKNESPGDDLFKNEGIKTIGNTYKIAKKQDMNIGSNKQPTKSKELSKTVQPKKESKSLFDLSDDDDDLFGKSTKTKKVEVKSKLFDSDSEEDLFSGKNNSKEESRRVKEVKVEGSLFGDDDDDLFGAKAKSTTLATTKITATTSRAVSKDTKAAEVVFDDPLSMLDDD